MGFANFLHFWLYFGYFWGGFEVFIAKGDKRAEWIFPFNIRMVKLPFIFMSYSRNAPSFATVGEKRRHRQPALVYFVSLFKLK